MVKEPSDELRIGAQVVHGGSDDGSEVSFGVQRIRTEPAFEESPNMLVGIEIRSIARKVVNADASLVGLQESTHRGRNVSGMSVEHQVDRLGEVLKQRLEKLQEHDGIQVARKASEPQAPTQRLQ